MEESKKKPIMVGAIIMCLILAVVIYQWTRPEDTSGKGIKNVWVKCADPDCGAVYEVDRDEYYRYIAENYDPAMIGMTPAMVCEQCGEPSVYKAIKCPKCGEVYFKNEAGDEDYPDSCPGCGYSEIEEKEKAKEK